MTRCGRRFDTILHAPIALGTSKRIPRALSSGDLLLETAAPDQIQLEPFPRNDPRFDAARRAGECVTRKASGLPRHQLPGDRNPRIQVAAGAATRDHDTDWRPPSRTVLPHPCLHQAADDAVAARRSTARPC